jgi:hypothetical protein
MTQALVARPGGKVLDDNLGYHDRDLLNFAVVRSEIAFQMSSQLQTYWPNSEKPDCLIWDSGWSDFHTP